MVSSSKLPRVRFSAPAAALFQLLEELDRPFSRLLPGSRARQGALRVLAREGPQTAAGLGRKLGLSRQAARQLGRGLCSAGWARLRPDPADRRAPRLHLTEAGLEACRQAAVLEAELLGRCAEGLEAQELRAVVRLLRGLRGRLAEAVRASSTSAAARFRPGGEEAGASHPPVSPGPPGPPRR